MWLPFTIGTILVCLFLARAREARSPLVLGLWFWLFGALAASPLFFSYPTVRYSPYVDVLVSTCIASVTIGFWFFRRSSVLPPTPRVDETDLKLAELFGWFGILGCGCLIADAYLNSGLSLSVSGIIDGLSDTRGNEFERLAEGAGRSALARAGGFLAPLSALVAIAAVRSRGRLPARLKRLAYSNVALIALVSFGVYAGRATITNLLVLGVICAYLAKPQAKRVDARSVVAVVLAAGFVWFLATGFLASRESNADGMRILEKTQRAVPSAVVRPVVDQSDALLYGLVSLGYFASPQPTLHVYFDAAESTGGIPGPFFGEYSFPLLAQLYHKIIGTQDPTTWLETRTEVFRPLEATGYFGNVWSTFVRDLLVDFGVIGAVLASFLLGGLLAWSRNGLIRTGWFGYAYCETLLTFVFGFGAFTSFMFNPFIGYPIFVSLMVVFFHRVISGRTV